MLTFFRTYIALDIEKAISKVLTLSALLRAGLCLHLDKILLSDPLNLHLINHKLITMCKISILICLRAFFSGVRNEAIYMGICNRTLHLQYIHITLLIKTYYLMKGFSLGYSSMNIRNDSLKVLVLSCITGHLTLLYSDNIQVGVCNSRLHLEYIHIMFLIISFIGVIFYCY